MFHNHRYVALAIVIALALFFAYLKADVFDRDINLSDPTSKMFYAKKGVLFLLTMLVLFVLVGQVNPLPKT